MEKGKESCAHSPTLNEEWIKTVLRETVCENSSYDEEIVRNRAEKIIIFNKCLDIYCKNGEEDYSYIIAKKYSF